MNCEPCARPLSSEIFCVGASPTARRHVPTTKTVGAIPQHKRSSRPRFASESLQNTQLNAKSSSHLKMSVKEVSIKPFTDQKPGT